MTGYVVTQVDDLSAGERIIVELEGKEIAVFRKDGEYHAYLNWCPHQAGPICEGQLTGTQRASYDRNSLELDTQWTNKGEILNCPWHGWEFDITSGECLSRAEIKLPTYPVKVENGDIIVSL